MHESWRVWLLEEVVVSSGTGTELAFAGPFSRIVLRHVPSAVCGALQRLAYPGDSVGRLLACLQESAMPGAVARFFYYLQSLAGRGLLRVSAMADGRPLATLMPMTPAWSLTHSRVSERPVALSRFAYLRREGEEAILESPLSAARIILHDHRAADLIYALTTPAMPAEIGSRAAALSPELSLALIQLLSSAGMLTTMNDAGRLAEDDQPSLISWEFHDLLFHAHSREGRHDRPVGNTYRYLGRLECPPAVKQVAADETVALDRPDLEQTARHDPPLSRVMEHRQSIRKYAAEPMTIRQLGEFLYRVARVRSRQQCQVETPQGVLQMDITSRPSPTGGSLFAMEIYPIVQACRGLDGGLYHYDPENHRLAKLAGLGPEAAMLLQRAGEAAMIPSDALQVLLVISARFQRVAWKYASLAYSLILKDVGVLMQNMYLAATAMGLGPCALGVGNSDLFARAIRSDYYEETSVGEFLLGSKAEASS